jgi:predicted transposase YbfD/YdcC
MAPSYLEVGASGKPGAVQFWKGREETAIYVSSVMLPAETFASAIRNHWAIENRNHWVKWTPNLGPVVKV